MNRRKNMTIRHMKIFLEVYRLENIKMCIRDRYNVMYALPYKYMYCASFTLACYHSNI